MKTNITHVEPNEWTELSKLPIGVFLEFKGSTSLFIQVASSPGIVVIAFASNCRPWQVTNTPGPNWRLAPKGTRLTLEQE